MIITYIHRIGWFIGVVVFQVLILNKPDMLRLFSIFILF